MNPTTKRALLNHMSQKGRDRAWDTERYPGEDMRRGHIWYETDRYNDGGVEDRSRDRRGREHYDDGRYAPMDMAYIPTANRQRRDSRGRYTTVRNEYHDPMYDGGAREEMRRYNTPTYPSSERRTERRQARPTNLIGFSADGEMRKWPDEVRHDYRMEGGYQPMDEMEYRPGSKTSGYGRSSVVAPLTRDMAKEWMAGLENEDGTHGPHWTLEQAKQVMAQRGIEEEPLAFWVTLCMMYSDYSEVAKKLGVNTIEFYACMAKAFLDDSDAVDDKLAAYYEYIVKH